MGGSRRRPSRPGQRARCFCHAERQTDESRTLASGLGVSSTYRNSSVVRVPGVDGAIHPAPIPRPEACRVFREVVCSTTWVALGEGRTSEEVFVLFGDLLTTTEAKALQSTGRVERPVRRGFAAARGEHRRPARCTREEVSQQRRAVPR